MLVASDDIISRTKRILRGIPVDDDTKALDVLDEIGPGGHFLGTTTPSSGSRPKTGARRWSTGRSTRLGGLGHKSYQQRVHERMIEILEAESEPLLDEKMYGELRRICELADAWHKDDELAVSMFV